ncbi:MULTISPECIES: hypothetical protein [Bacillus cereus group]|nr:MULTISPECIES: hypothetical protein [Bacillus cereus group]MDA1902349.1 hypothetical protein [Bacillus cereus group sp. BcHK20]MCC2351114.1 hypothetical protein [Bacillus pacificus]MCC2468081.1 hypothetical protein [Bacillus pacificus]MCC2483795.1 hypothetical protein [Bacillus pacificus]MCU5398958.1 hypothetical protein [Bacillus pacificus]
MLDRLSREYYIIENTVAKGVDSVTPFVKGVEIMPDGSVVRSGTNYSGKFQEAHDASKASIQSRVSNLESGGVKGTGDIGTPPRYGERRISKELYDELRDGTPTAKLREKVNEGIEDKIGTPDPALPGKYITDRLQADHIVSMKNMAKMENFDKLTKEQQLKVLNNEENFLGLSEAANKSKGSKSYSDWTIYKKEKIEVDPKFREEMIKKEKELEMKLQKQIDDFVEGNKKDIDK